MNTLLHLAERIYREFGLTPAFRTLLKEMILQEHGLTQEAIDIAIRTLSRACRLSHRAAIKEGCIEGGQKYLFSDWPLMDGTKLAQATRERIADDAERYRKLATGNARCCNFLWDIVRKLQEGQKVCERFTEEDLSELWQKTLS